MKNNKKNYVIFLVFSLVLCSHLYAATDSTLTLEKSIEIALEQNTEIILAQEDKKMAEAQTLSAWSTVFPKLTIETDYSKVHSKQQMAQLSFLPPAAQQSISDPADAYVVKFSAQQILYSGQVGAALEAAQYGVDLADNNLAAKKNSVVYTTKEAYINVLKTDELLKSALENKKLIEQLISQTEALISAGLATRADLLKLQLQLKNIEQLAIIADSTTKISRQQFNLVLGFPIDRSISLQPFKGTNYREYANVSLPDLVKLAMNQRKELEVLDYSIKLYNTQISAIASATQPMVFISGTYGLLSDNYSYDLEKDKDWIVALVAKWNFYDGGDAQSKVDSTRSTIAKLQEQRKQLVNGITLELSSIISSITSSIARIGVSQKELELARENVKIASEKYVNGLGTNLDVVTSQTSLLTAQTNLINSQYDFEIAKAKLNKAVGEVNKI
ncbi:MAG: hypothetical protein DKM50_00030 [Candidatus Margulisiibacteriota bacterium]|nr:MAG: hypothetical protein A2X43_03235 [Candidatus Margulisbacteria bacterium GWD2_39_127]OGI02184.1 MAG: hypothetical protein A2X42_08570 [Candidatus Margulisbacteria bacterium GWF2_38_17]OGI09022.1 MAG: hypothetical protein A2X41_01695 [Candidatus Margulisbacteria bacterium GWE2_39_32]PZM84989.1 MAG: hypothetical protein DKM50_00030 [Candidatus Margulisiibacteriota bacterium]HAR63191.1 hypothetical protein [Candidatus Margulisiibacteriota bacterium]